MKTKLVRPIFIESKDNESREIVLVSLDPEEKIEVGDVFLYQFGPFERDWEIINCTKENIEGIRGNCKKVIATQDRISSEDIQKFIDKYNANGKLEDVEIEVEDSKYIPIRDDEGTKYGESLRKVTPFPKLTNGFITIIKPMLHMPDKTDEFLQRCIDRSDRETINFKDATLEEIKERFPQLYTEEDMKDFGLFLDNNVKKFKNKTIDALFNTYLGINNITKELNKSILYTEEEVKRIARNANVRYQTNEMDDKEIESSFDEWFEKIKKQK